jgi:para-nitrobenzyl esterase
LAGDLLKETQTATMEELLQLSTESLKDAAQKLWRDMCAPTCDGTLIPADVYQAWRNGEASDIGVIIGIPGHEMQVFRSFVGNRNYIDGIIATMTDIQKQDSMDDSTAKAVQAYIDAQTVSSSELEAKSKLVEQWLALCIYRNAVKLSAGGNHVHLMYWDEKPLIENLGSGSVDVAAALLGNGEALQMYGSVMNADLSATLQSLLIKFVHGDTLQLYPNEIKGIDAVNWNAYPLALIVSDGKLVCDTIENRLTEVRDLFDYIMS